MKTEKRILTPVLLGGDLNAYSMAMSFADAFGVSSYVFARDKLAMTNSSSYIKLRVVKGLDDCNVAVKALTDFAKKHKNERLLLIPCADWYMEMLEYARDVLHGYFFFHIPQFEIWRATSDKASFMRLMEKYGIPHPKTAVFDESLQSFQAIGAGMKPPFVVKASDSTEYWRHPFEGMKKVYFTDTLSEALHICKKILDSGYGGKLLLQEYVGECEGAEPPSASVLTTYSDKNGKVIRAVMGDILLEEKGATSTGNYSAIVTRPLDKIAQKLIAFLESIGYTGIANFDILRADGKSYCLELNPRQGRSFDYVRCAGMSMARLLENEFLENPQKEKFTYTDGLWRSVSWHTVKKYCGGGAVFVRADKLRKKGLWLTPYKRKAEEGIRRRLYVAIHLYRQEKNYKKLKKESATCC